MGLWWYLWLWVCGANILVMCIYVCIRTICKWYCHLVIPSIPSYQVMRHHISGPVAPYLVWGGIQSIYAMLREVSDGSILDISTWCGVWVCTPRHVIVVLVDGYHIQVSVVVSEDVSMGTHILVMRMYMYPYRM